MNVPLCAKEEEEEEEERKKEQKEPSVWAAAGSH